MPKRCILLFPDFQNMHVIQGIRRRYDPAYDKVAPHVTLVFPFDSDIGTEELRAHMHTALLGVDPFTLMLRGISAHKSFGNYLLLDVRQGRSKVIEIHRRLYTGLLAGFQPQWRRSFEPHMTVGKIADSAAFAAAYEATRGEDTVFCTCMREIAVEIIGEDDSSFIEFTMTLPVK